MSNPTLQYCQDSHSMTPFTPQYGRDSYNMSYLTPGYGQDTNDSHGNDSSYDGLMPFSESSVGYDITRWGWISVGPIVLVLGTFGNSMILATVGRVMTDLASLRVYLIGLAVSDTVSLYSVVLPALLRCVSGWDTMSAHRWACKVLVWVSLSSTLLSAWLLVALTVHRAASVLFPHKVRVFCTHTKSLVVTVVLAAISLLLYAHTLYGMEIKAFPNPSSDQMLMECGPYLSVDYLHLRRVVSTVDLVIFSLLPFSCLLVCNVALSWTLVSSVRRARYHLTAANTTRRNSRDKNASSTTVTVLALSLTYIVLVLPVALMDMLVHTKPSHWATEYTWLHEATFIPLSVNYAINFYVYCMTGAKFRHEFTRAVFGLVRRAQDTGASSSGCACTTTSTSFGSSRL